MKALTYLYIYDTIFLYIYPLFLQSGGNYVS